MHHKELMHHNVRKNIGDIVYSFMTEVHNLNHDMMN